MACVSDSCGIVTLSIICLLLLPTPAGTAYYSQDAAFVGSVTVLFIFVATINSFLKASSRELEKLEFHVKFLGWAAVFAVLPPIAMASFSKDSNVVGGLVGWSIVMIVVLLWKRTLFRNRLNEVIRDIEIQEQRVLQQQVIRQQQNELERQRLEHQRQQQQQQQQPLNPAGLPFVIDFKPMINVGSQPVLPVSHVMHHSGQPANVMMQPMPPSGYYPGQMQPQMQPQMMPQQMMPQQMAPMQVPAYNPGYVPGPDEAPTAPPTN